jgi:hypothetical protein
VCSSRATPDLLADVAGSVGWKSPSYKCVLLINLYDASLSVMASRYIFKASISVFLPAR